MLIPTAAARLIPERPNPMPGPPQRSPHGRTWGAAVSESQIAENKARRLALANALLAPRIENRPPPTLPLVPGWESFQALRLRILLAAFGERIHLDVLRAQRNVDRMRRALEKYKTDAGVRLNVRPATLLGSAFWSPWDEYARPRVSHGLFGRYTYPSPPPLSPEEERKKQKASQAARRIEELEEKVSVLLQHLRDANQRAGDFIRSLAIRGALSADTIDAAAHRRHVAPAAWENDNNWRRLLKDRQLEAGTQWGVDPGFVYFPRAEADTVAGFIAERGEAGLDNVGGAVRALGGISVQGRVFSVAPAKLPHTSTLDDDIRKAAAVGGVTPAMRQRDRDRKIQKWFTDQERTAPSPAKIRGALKDTPHIKARPDRRKGRR